MYGIYANIWGILMVNVTIYIAYMDPMGKGFNQQNGDLITPWLILHTPPKD